MLNTYLYNFCFLQLPLILGSTNNKMSIFCFVQAPLGAGVPQFLAKTALWRNSSRLSTMAPVDTNDAAFSSLLWLPLCADPMLHKHILK